MANSTRDLAKGCIFQWKIENLFHWWWMKDEGEIGSPIFVAENLKKTRWTLWFYPIDSNAGMHLQREEDSGGPNTIEVTYQFAILGKDGTILKKSSKKKDNFTKNQSCEVFFMEMKGIFFFHREIFLPEDTLRVQCTIRIAGQRQRNLNKISASTVIKVKRRFLEWKIDQISNLTSDMKSKFSDDLIACNLHLQEHLDKLYLNLSDLNDSIRYISCNTSIIDSKGRKENCGIKKYYDQNVMEVPLNFTYTLSSETWVKNKDHYFPNDVLSFDFEFVLMTVELSDCSENHVNLENGVAENKESQNMSVLTDNLYTLFQDPTSNVIKLQTVTKTFVAHRNVLSASSPVFKRIISRDLTNSRTIYITDFEEDTVLQMLNYIYSNTLKDLKFDSANKLYRIAYKYEILSLKSECSSFFTANLRPENACNILVLTDLHDDLIKDVQNYILRHHKEIFCSQEWKNLTKTHTHAHVKLAADTMYKKLSSKSNF